MKNEFSKPIGEGYELMTLKLYENDDDDQLYKVILTKLLLANFFRLFSFCQMFGWFSTTTVIRP